MELDEVQKMAESFKLQDKKLNDNSVAMEFIKVYGF